MAQALLRAHARVAYYSAIFAAGLASSLHCLGMCGGFALALGAGGTGGTWQRQFLYHLGRVNTLVFVGTLSGGLGGALVAAGPVETTGKVLAVVGGALMLVVGMEMLGILPGLTGRGAAVAHAAIGHWLRGPLRSSSPIAPLAFGVFNAFLPCHLIYAFAARAAATGSPVDGGLTMLAFGLGTVPALLSVVSIRPLARAAARGHLHLLSAVMVLAFGALTIMRAFSAPACH